MTENLISVVDDDESVRRNTALLIESFGLRAAILESAETFLKSSHLHDTSCLIVDVQMPGMNGLQLQSHLATAGCSVPIIFISAYESNNSRQQAMQAGAAAFLGKPFSDEQLLQCIRSVLGFPHRNDCRGQIEDRNVSLTHASCNEFGVQPMLDVRPIIFVVDDDISVRESLELLIRSEGWQPETFSSGQEFLTRPRVLVPSCLVLDVFLPGLKWSRTAKARR